MRYYNDFVITDAGAAMIQTALNNGDSITFTRSAIGDATYTPAEKEESALKVMTALKHERNSYGFSSRIIREGKLCLAVTYTNYDPDTQEALVMSDYKIMEIGIFARAGSGTEQLFLITTASGSMAEYMLAYDGVAPVYILQDFKIPVDTSAEINVNFDPSAFLLASDIEIVAQQVKDSLDLVESTTVFNQDGSIDEITAAGTKTTVFNQDGSITETYPSGQSMTTTFNQDGSISRTLDSVLSETK